MGILLLLSCGCGSSITKFEVVVSSAIPEDSSSSSSLSHQPRSIKMKKPNKLPKTDYKKKQQQPSILEIERAIGAGIFRDRDVNSGGGGEKSSSSSSLFDGILKNSVGKNEGSEEKRLRETGEWLIHQTDTTSRSADTKANIEIDICMDDTSVGNCISGICWSRFPALSLSISRRSHFMTRSN